VFVIGEVEVTNEVSLAPSAVLAEGAVVGDGDLTVKVNSFYYDFGGVHGKYAGSVANAVANNATNYIYLSESYSLGVSQVSYPATAHIRLARVIAAGGIIVRVILERAFFTAGLASSISSSAKAGIVVPGSFSGTPKRATVAFTSPYASTSYSIVLTVLTDGTKTFVTAVESKTVNGFVVNLGANNLANLVEVGWHTMAIGS
jgi:hypothetical protein